MSTRIVYTIECHCGENAENVVWDTTNPQPDGSLLIDIEMVAGQTDFARKECGCVIGTGDLDTEVVSQGYSCEGDSGDSE